MSGHSWSFPNVCKGVTQSCLALGSLLLLECAQGTDKWLDPWLSSQCEQKGEGEEPGWFGSLMEAPSWKFLGALHTQHYERRRNLPNHRKGLSREGLSPRPSPAGESCQPGGAQCQEAPCLLLLSCEVILGEATSPRDGARRCAGVHMRERKLVCRSICPSVRGFTHRAGGGFASWRARGAGRERGRAPHLAPAPASASQLPPRVDSQALSPSLLL